MAQIINLRLARKAKQRADKDSAAQNNRALHGETKAQKLARKADMARGAKLLDGAKLESDE